MNPMIRVLLASLEKDEHGIPTTKSLIGLMEKIDQGVVADGWHLGKRAALMKRITTAAVTQREAIEKAPR